LTFHTFLLSERQVIQAAVDLGNEFIELHHPLRLHPQRAPRRIHGPARNPYWRAELIDCGPRINPKPRDC
jgi:hypothetical protein